MSSLINQSLLQDIEAIFEQRSGKDPAVRVQSPGRINLIGEHTDYNNGFVLPAAIDKSVYMALGPSQGRSSFYALDMKEAYSFSVHEPLDRSVKGWASYLLGVVDQIYKSGKALGEFTLVFGGDIPMGSGLSSSAALENAACFGLNELFDLGFSRIEMIKMSQMAEHEFAGVKCGIMDQFASMMGQEGNVIRLDCESLDYEYYPLELEDYALVLCNSNVHHSLAGSEYNIRRSQCEQGVELLKKYSPGIRSLRDVPLELLEAHRHELEKVTYRRCRYVIEENQRLILFCDKLKQKDFEAAGQLLFRAHQGLSEEYEVSCPEIDFMVEYARKSSGVIGSRMMGGGFGGCTINLIRKGFESAFIHNMSLAYEEKFKISLAPIQVRIANGVNVI